MRWLRSMTQRFKKLKASKPGTKDEPHPLGLAVEVDTTSLFIQALENESDCGSDDDSEGRELDYPEASSESDGSDDEDPLPPAPAPRRTRRVNPAFLSADEVAEDTYHGDTIYVHPRLPVVPEGDTIYVRSHIPAVPDRAPICPASKPVKKLTAAAKEKRAKKSRTRRVAKDQKRRTTHLPLLKRPRIAVLRILRQLTQISSQLDTDKLPVASGCWIGKLVAPLKNRPWKLGELLRVGFRYLKWDGLTPHVMTEKKELGMVTLVGQPSTAEWRECLRETNEALKAALKEGQADGTFKEDDGTHRRGRFHMLVDGVSFGGGQKKPGNLRLSGRERKLMNRLKDLRGIKRIAGFQSSAFALYAPKLYKFYHDTLGKLYKHNRNLTPVFPSISIYPAFTINLGPRTETLDHTDKGNVAHGLCSITALGDYDPSKGGHLILFDLGLIIEFPPGATVLIPSGIFRHGNTPVGPGECRMSMTQYCAGGLFRWVRYGFKTVSSVSKDTKRKMDGNFKDRVKRAMRLFSKFDELEQDRDTVFGSLK